MSWLISDNWEGGNTSFMENNAQEFYLEMHSKGYSLNSICAMLGNIQLESAINPTQKELPTSQWTNQKGFGLCQWTPAQSLFDYCEVRGLSFTDGTAQCIYLNDTGSLYWGNSQNPYAPSVSPPITWSDFTVSELSLDTLTDYFMYYYEKPNYEQSQLTKEERRNNASQWYDFLSENPPTPPSRRKKMPLYFYLLPC